MIPKSNLKPLLAAASVGSMIVLTGCVGMDAIAAGPMGDMAATAAGIPQTTAFLPNKSAVAPGLNMAIDGTYTISTLGKRITIDRGRGYAVDGWTHALTLKIQPDMVTLRNITQIDDTTYSGDDLPLLGKATLKVQPDGSIATVVAGMIPYRYTLIPASGYIQSPVDDSPPPSSDDDVPGAPSSDIANCETVAMDPDTNALICLD
ncbi:MAG: hypothetical protein AAFO74_16930 [Pseudomonadota bacterium]